MTDISDWINGTHRELRDHPSPGGEARAVVLRRRYDAEIEDVWDACTDPDRIVRWFLPVSGNLRPGGRFSLQGNASGEILRCDAPRLLRVTWEFGGGVSEVEVRLSAGEGGDTVLELEHAPVPREIELDGRRVDMVLNDAATGMWGLGTGWEMGLYGLGAYLRGEMPDGPAIESFDESDPKMQALAAGFGEAWASVVQDAERRR